MTTTTPLSREGRRETILGELQTMQHQNLKYSYVC